MITGVFFALHLTPKVYAVAYYGKSPYLFEMTEQIKCGGCKKLISINKSGKCKECSSGVCKNCKRPYRSFSHFETCGECRSSPKTREARRGMFAQKA